MITDKPKRDLIEYMKRYGTNPDELIERLDAVKKLHKENLNEYENIPEQKSHRKSCDAIAKHAKALSQALSNTPDYLQQDIDKKFKSVTGFPGYVDGLRESLKILHFFTDGLGLNRNLIDIDGNTRPMKKKSEFYRDCLIRSLRLAYKDFTDKEPDTGQDFNTFMVYACDYMGIMHKGLQNKHEELTTQNKLR